MRKPKIDIKNHKITNLHKLNDAQLIRVRDSIDVEIANRKLQIANCKRKARKVSVLSKLIRFIGRIGKTILAKTDMSLNETNKKRRQRDVICLPSRVWCE